jgi:outer membrane receptor for ferric coprogen and ferric-rhodotorulic acid
MNLRARQLARALRPLALATPLLAGLAATPAALAQATQRYDIPAGPLAATLGRLGAQAGILLSFSAAQTEGRLSPGVRGALDVP